MVHTSLLLLLLAASTTFAFTVDRYDLTNIVWDLKPVTNLVGRWRLTGLRGNQPKVLSPPNSIDFAVHPLPHFGSRALNVTKQWYHNNDPARVSRTDYGFLPVKNATRHDPRIHAALLTSSSLGFSMQEQGLIDLPGPKLRTHLKLYIKRSFDLDGPFPKLAVTQLERLIDVLDYQYMRMTVSSQTNYGQDDYTAEYTRVAPS